MQLGGIFEPQYLGDKDTDTERVCGTCGILKPVTEFYKDGKNGNGKVRYRRDCKDCYKLQRVRDAALKLGGKHHV